MCCWKVGGVSPEGEERAVLRWLRVCLGGESQEEGRWGESGLTRSGRAGGASGWRQEGGLAGLGPTAASLVWGGRSPGPSERLNPRVAPDPVSLSTRAHLQQSLLRESDTVRE